MHGDRTDGIVDAALFPEKDRYYHQPASHCPDDHRACWVNKGARRGNGHQTSQHAITAHSWIRLEALQHERQHRGQRCDNASKHGVHHNEADAQVRPGKRRARIEAEPAEGKNKGAKTDEGHAMSRYGLRPPMRVILPDTGADDHGTSERDDAAHRVHDS
jgi:hypothetical protein